MVRGADSPRDPWLAKDVSATVRAWERRRDGAGEVGAGPLVNVSVTHVTPGLAEALRPAPEHLVTLWTLLRPV